MTPEASITPRPNPPQRSWFAVWTWSRWARCTACILIVLLPVSYFLSYAPIALWLKTNGQGRTIAYDCAEIVYAPLDAIIRRNGALQRQHHRNWKYWSPIFINSTDRNGLGEAHHPQEALYTSDTSGR